MTEKTSCTSTFIQVFSVDPHWFTCSKRTRIYLYIYIHSVRAKHQPFLCQTPTKHSRGAVLKGKQAPGSPLHGCSATAACSLCPSCGGSAGSPSHGCSTAAAWSPSRVGESPGRWGCRRAEASPWPSGRRCESEHRPARACVQCQVAVASGRRRGLRVAVARGAALQWIAVASGSPSRLEKK